VRIAINTKEPGVELSQRDRVTSLQDAPATVASRNSKGRTSHTDTKIGDLSAVRMAMSKYS